MASEEPVVYDRRRKAQDLAYKAMGAGSPQEVVRLCGQAILLDQRCVDALVLLNEALEEPEGRIVQLQQVIEVALEDLGGPHFLEENRGDFWGVVETRPYMRARESLASAYYQAGMVEESAAELEAMIELNPNDNQGVRYQLVGLYLELDRPEAVRRLVAEYAEDRSPMFAWSVVLERFLAGDMPGADQALAKARETNPYVEDYLLGRKVLPADTPRFYRLGDQHEAVICAYAIIRSWHLHPKAQDWLWERAVPPSVSAPVKVGRNDPCPCGSGKKYKKCCLGRDLAAEAILSNPAAAERAMLDLRRAMESQEFADLEEAQAFVDDYYQQQNRTPLEDFAGLSPEQMHKLNNSPFDSPDVVEFVEVLEVEPVATITELLAQIVEAVGDKGLKLTVRDNLPRNVVRQIASAQMDEQELDEYCGSEKIYKEQDYPDLHITKIVAEFAGLLRLSKGQLTLTRKYHELASRGGMRAIYPVLLRAYVQELNWGYAHVLPEIDAVQQFFAFTLYLLACYGDRWRSSTFYEDKFLNAFPMVINEVEPTEYFSAEEVLRQTYTLRSFVQFGDFMGLVESEDPEHFWIEEQFAVRKTPLLDAVVRFHCRRPA